MRNDLERPLTSAHPLVGGVEKIAGAPRAADQERDEDILLTLRRKLRERSMDDTPAPASKRKHSPGQEDKYEPQRLSRKICWQYDSNARKIPLLRRHYI